MSLETWVDEFYPIPAVACPADKAVEHSLRKWVGLRPENLAKHDVKFSGGQVVDAGPDAVSINSGTCALCVHYNGDDGCSGCPLYVKREYTPCDQLMEGEVRPPYQQMMSEEDPEPMIRWLEQCSREVRDAL